MIGQNWNRCLKEKPPSCRGCQYVNTIYFSRFCHSCGFIMTLLGLIESKHWIHISSLTLRIVAQEGSQCQKLTTYLHFYFLWKQYMTNFVCGLYRKFCGKIFFLHIYIITWTTHDYHFTFQTVLWYDETHHWWVIMLDNLLICYCNQTLPSVCPDWLSVKIFVQNIQCSWFSLSQLIISQPGTEPCSEFGDRSGPQHGRSTEGRPSVLQVEVPARGEAIKYPMRLHQDRESSGVRVGCDISRESD